MQGQLGCWDKMTSIVIEESDIPHGATPGGKWSVVLAPSPVAMICAAQVVFFSICIWMRYQNVMQMVPQTQRPQTTFVLWFFALQPSFSRIVPLIVFSILLQIMFVILVRLFSRCDVCCPCRYCGLSRKDMDMYTDSNGVEWNGHDSRRRSKYTHYHQPKWLNRLGLLSVLARFLALLLMVIIVPVLLHQGSPRGVHIDCGDEAYNASDVFQGYCCWTFFPPFTVALEVDQEFANLGNGSLDTGLEVHFAGLEVQFAEKSETIEYMSPCEPGFSWQVYQENMQRSLCEGKETRSGPWPMATGNFSCLTVDRPSLERRYTDRGLTCPRTADNNCNDFERIGERTSTLQSVSLVGVTGYGASLLLKLFFTLAEVKGHDSGFTAFKCQLL